MAIYENKRLGVSLEITGIRVKNVQAFFDAVLPAYNILANSWVILPNGKRKFDATKALADAIESRVLSSLLSGIYIIVNKRNDDGTLDKNWLEDATINELAEVLKEVVEENTSFFITIMQMIVKLIKSASEPIEKLAA